MTTVLHVDTETFLSEYVVAVAKEGQPVEIYWPGKDFPDREEWLKRRAAQRVKPKTQCIYAGKQPLALGINAAKRRAKTDEERSRIVAHRHEYYRARYGEQT